METDDQESGVKSTQSTPEAAATSTKALLGELVLEEGTSSTTEFVTPVTAPTKAKRGRKRKDQNDDSMETLKASQKRTKFYNEAEQKCSECDFVTNKRLLLKKHCILKHADKMDTFFLLNQYKCDFCEKVFKDPIQLSNHKNVHLGLKPYKCVECENTFTTRGELIRHTRYKHTLERPHKCPDCDYSSVELSKLKRHMRVHTDERPYLCLYCDYASRDTFKLKRHIRVHTGEKPYECPECKACFSQSNSLKVHMKNSHAEGSRAQKKSVRKRLKLVEEPVTKVEASVAVSPARSDKSAESAQPVKTAYYLSVDDSYYTNEKYLEATQVVANTSGSGQTTTNTTTATTTTTQAYATFVQTDVVIEDEQNIFTCQECSMKFTNAELLEEHFIRHSGDRPFKCTVCDRRFGAKFALRSHLLSHDEAYTQKLKSKLKSINEATNQSLRIDQLINSSREKDAGHTNLELDSEKATESASPKDASPEDASPEDASPEDASPENASPENASSNKMFPLFTKGKKATSEVKVPKKRGRPRKT